MPAYDRETLTVSRCLRHLKDLKTMSARRRVVQYLTSAVEDMPPEQAPEQHDARQLTIPGSQKKSAELDSPFADAE